MKKKYEKPQVCSMNYETGKIISSSEMFAERSRELKRIFEKSNGRKKEFADEKEIAGKS